MGALQWLKQHNKFYRNIEISQAALDQLPEDGSLSSLREVEMDADDELELQTTDDPNIQDSASFVPVVVRKMTEEDSIRKSVQERQSAAPKLTTCLGHKWVILPLVSSPRRGTYCVLSPHCCQQVRLNFCLHDRTQSPLATTSSI